MRLVEPPVVGKLRTKFLIVIIDLRLQRKLEPFL